MKRRWNLFLAFTLLMGLVGGGVSTVQAAGGYQVGFQLWRGADFGGWTKTAVISQPDGILALDYASTAPGSDPAGAYNGRNFHNGGSYRVGEATSPVLSTFAFYQAIAYWDVVTPTGTAPRTVTPSTGNPALWNTLLAVPECSQMVYPDGGNRWCSPTSTSMVLGYRGIDPGECAPRVLAAVTGVYDWVYNGYGNWPFNTAYTASMADLEPWIHAGTTIASSSGHLIGSSWLVLTARAPPSSMTRPPLPTKMSSANNCSPSWNPSGCATPAEPCT